MDFIKETKRRLDIPKEKMDRVCAKGFDLDPNDNIAEDCVLVIGLNPAGDEKDVEYEKTHKNYYYYIGIPAKNNLKWQSPRYYKPIYQFIQDVYRDSKGTVTKNIKWPWCNKKDPLKQEKDLEIKEYKDAIQEFYDKSDCSRKGRESSNIMIYIADMYYYHERNAKTLLKMVKAKDPSADCQEVLQAHIDELEAHNKNIKFVYCNNAEVSRQIAGGKVIKSYEIVCSANGTKIPVFYGAMLSNGQTDVAARIRLINEIKRTVK